MLLSLVLGAFCRLLEVQGEVLPSWKGVSLDWGLTLVAMVVGWNVELPSLDAFRLSLNAYLSEQFNIFDLADNPALINKLDLAELLHSPPRQGAYADYLSRKYPFDVEDIEVGSHYTIPCSSHFFVGKWIERFITIQQRDISFSAFTTIAVVGLLAFVDIKRLISW